MCGVLCLYNSQKRIDEKVLSEMIDALQHRGPDAKGQKIYCDHRLGLGNTRLSLIDLKSRSNMPLELDGFSITYNGEIYNHKEIRGQLEVEGAVFKTTSDTEVIIRSIQKWGIKALNKFNGCFAFVLYDNKNKKLFIVRDPLGKKQIVYTLAKNGDWVFASEIKALLKHPYVTAGPNINRFISDLIFKFFSDKKETHFKGIYHILPGHYFEFDLEKKKNPKIVKYWDIDLIETKRNDPSGILDEYVDLLHDSVRLRMDADTEIGSLLSGGIDSSSITKLASEFHNEKYKTPFQCFTIEYVKENRDFRNVKLLCREMKNTKLNKVAINSEWGINDVDKLTYSLEEPLLDKVFFAQHENYRIARKHNLKAVINGQGADELWLGYYFFYNIFRLNPREINRTGLMHYWMKGFDFKHVVSNKTKKLAKEIIESNLDKNFVSYQNSDKLDSLVRYSIKTHLQSMFMQEDRLSMANGVEVRLPHVDTRIFKLALATPSKFKIWDKKEKYIPRTAAKLNNLLPKSIYNRRKLAFPDPPSDYDREIEKAFNKKELIQSPLISELFRIDSNFFYKLPLRKRWELIAIYRMEKVFFEN
ncbi:MAG: asparagine synthase (glutamine-hydrolyzing) [Candidatus Moranbacteria bacterium CG_4_10_14_3_um_filter_44_15]|nr:MAG: asparagine synthase (glutamine-hydrolyzing) [Candidatus Moranbacteria bacterium CG06_land_8_20_14_3_00_43_56]PIV83964.1 MAG: asparagine synthase (glutamine-hydrolyzing) [Candidatus Moranbacteria bacterium CG17_big_fil_post_rev_8_21_14_2_50_44_12]PIW93172.1 MAG: asparagine synthase (glutamine-hydrolyzing) [Candidatus Moranbacteria bacterium CG_4_8_14_3_um_filter_43_15]PIX90653.1 MAG: asparagine synthase (glutamine-hydrolyzing) [Candidatus Moranbacteria bacterium CG_4_10_14_3_um_filter_44_